MYKFYKNIINNSNFFDQSAKFNLLKNMDFIFNTYRFIKPLNVEFLCINNKFILFRSVVLFLSKINTLKKCLRLIN